MATSLGLGHPKESIVVNWFGESSKYPSLTDFLNCGGHLKIGHIYQMNVAAIAVIEKNVVWQGKPKYQSLHELLSDADLALRDVEE